jgi:hypothetical protein
MFHERHLQRAVEIQHWIAYHQNNIEVARRLPLTQAIWEEEGGHIGFAHMALNMSEAKLHEILVAGVIADAERQIADLRDELQRLGVSMGSASPQPVPAPRFAIVHEAMADEPISAGQAVHVVQATATPVRSNPRAVVTRMKKVVGGHRK